MANSAREGKGRLVLPIWLFDFKRYLTSDVIAKGGSLQDDKAYLYRNMWFRLCDEARE